MEQEQIKARVTDIFSYRLGVDKTSISSETTLNGLGADYLEQAEILIEIEKEFGFDFNNYVEMGVESFDKLSYILNWLCIKKKI